MAKPRKAVRRVVRKTMTPTPPPQTRTQSPISAVGEQQVPPAVPSGVTVRLDSAEDAEFRYVGNNRVEIQRRFPSDVAKTIIAEKLETRSQTYLPDASRKVHQWHDKRVAGVMKAWDAMDAALNPTGNYEVHAISFIRDTDKPVTDDNIGWFISWNTPI